MFKVGDKVILNKDRAPLYGQGAVKYGETGTITKIDKQEYWVDFPSQKGWHGEKDDVILKLFKKSDLKDGDVVTQRDGCKKIVCNKATNLRGINECMTSLSINNYTDDLKDRDRQTQYDIIKVERPVKYETVYESKEEILDEAEKRYLRAVIRPFRDKVVKVTKDDYLLDYEFIKFTLKDDSFALPDFKKGTMYKNMKLNKKYTLEELRTIKE